jgi:hypothetical protein
MKGKLIKTDKDNYILVDSTKGVYDKGYLIGSSRESDVDKLSKQNCDEIFGVTDVEKLAIEYDLYEKINFVGQTRAYKAGFNKAMELNKDKVFTLEDMKRAIRFGFDVGFCSNSDNKLKRLGLSEDEFIQSLNQPTEIEVEIVMECCGNYSPPCNINCEYGGKPKLDAEGQLILKKN